MSAEKNVAVTTVPEGDRVYASAMHLFVWVGWIWGMFAIGISAWLSMIPGIILPIGMWLAARNNDFVYQQGRNLAKFILFATFLIPLGVIMVGVGIAYTADGASKAAERLLIIFSSDADVPMLASFVLIFDMISDMEVWSLLKVIMWGIVILVVLRPAISPLRAVYRAMKGKESDYTIT